MSSEREQVLACIRAGIRGGGRPSPDCDAEYAAIPRGYERRGTLDAQARLALFAERLRDYGVEVRSVAEKDVALAVGERLIARGARRTAVPAGFPEDWRPAGFTFIEADALSPAELDALDGVLTACTVAMAETGTLALQAGPAQGPRRVSLIPDYHLCVVREAQIVETVPEGLARLAAALPTTLISGPSATSDIEMTRIRGVHGPRTLDVIVATELALRQPSVTDPPDGTSARKRL